MSDNLISFNDCAIGDIHNTLLNNITWTMKTGEAWLVTGANGGGKESFLQALCGEKEVFPSFNHKSVFMKSTEIVSLEKAASIIEEERKYDETEYMDRIDEGRTGRRFICEVLGGPDVKHRHDPLPAIAARLETLPEVKLCGVEHILDRGLRYMSTGEIRRILLCRALLSGKRLLILSDPFAGLDVNSRAILLDFFSAIAARQHNFDDKEQCVRVILCMERYTEIPETITNVVEFTDNSISFNGTKSEYEQELKRRDLLLSDSRIEEKASLINAYNELKSDTRYLHEQHIAGEETLIQMNDVNVGWSDHKVLRNLNWSVLPGEHWLIRGPNGSGKTTLLELITGDNPQVFCNDVWLFGRKRGTGETIWDIKKKLGIVSYRLHVEYRMLTSVTLEDVIISGFHDSIGLYEPKTDMEKNAADKWLSLAGFKGRGNEMFSSLSYGEQRAVLIVRAAVKQPRVLILDEPCHGLDGQYRQKILNLLEAVAATGTTTLLHVTHDVTEVLPCEKHIMELCPGEDTMYRIICGGQDDK